MTVLVAGFASKTARSATTSAHRPLQGSVSQTFVSICPAAWPPVAVLCRPMSRVRRHQRAAPPNASGRPVASPAGEPRRERRSTHTTDAWPLPLPAVGQTDEPGEPHAGAPPQTSRNQVRLFVRIDALLRYSPLNPSQRLSPRPPGAVLGQSRQVAGAVAGVELAQGALVPVARPGARRLLANRPVEGGGELLIEGESAPAVQKTGVGVDHQ